MERVIDVGAYARRLPPTNASPDPAGARPRDTRRRDGVRPALVALASDARTTTARRTVALRRSAPIATMTTSAHAPALDEIRFGAHVPDDMASHFPDLRRDEPATVRRQ